MKRLEKALFGLLCSILPSCSSSDDRDVEPSVVLEPARAIARPMAPAAGSACALAPEGVTTIELPMFPELTGSPTFGYSFRVRPGLTAGAPTVIFLPGGPGETSIGTERDPALIPIDYTLIETDPRGVGCNAPQELDHYPPDFYDSAWLASDVLGIVRELALEDYILYGVSYGTLLATLTAAKAEAEGVTPPSAVVLEGVIGQSFSRDGQVEEGFQSHWRTVRDRLPESVGTQLRTTPLPLALSPEQWGSALTGMLSVATVAPPLTLAESLLLALLPEATEQDRQALYETVLGLNSDPVDDFGWRMHEAVSCHEITETNFRQLSLDGGELVRTEAYCETEPLDRTFTASRWPVRVPLYYFSGTDDPNTPPWQAQAHYDAMVGAPRTLVSVIAAGHNPVAFNLPDCQAALWTAITTGAAFAEALATCAWPTQLTTAAPRG